MLQAVVMVIEDSSERVANMMSKLLKLFCDSVLITDNQMAQVRIIHSLYSTIVCDLSPTFLTLWQNIKYLSGNSKHCHYVLLNLI